MTHLLYELASNPKLPLTSRYEFARYLQAQRKLEKYRSMKIPPAYDSTGKIIRRAVQVS